MKGTDAMSFSNADEVYAYLNRFLNFERRLEPSAYRLDRMFALKELFGAPDEAYEIWHVTGSKGKGSTATMIASILRETGARVGLYTSPHLLSFTERIAIDGAPVEEAVLLRSAEELEAGLRGRAPEDFPGGEAPTYFELLTMLGFLCFRAAGCTHAVIEVGLGGRLDSTNVVKPAATFITTIELEHTELLGDTIPKIAYEKAGIIKPGHPAYSSAWRGEAREVIRRAASERGSSLRELDEEAELTELRIGRSGTSFKLSLRDEALRAASGVGTGAWELFVPLIGEVQARNAALAALGALDRGIAPKAIADGLAKARIRARFEILDGEPLVVLDGAHTPDSAAACARDFMAAVGSAGILLFGCAKDKDPAGMAAALRSVASRVIVTKPGTFKESEPEKIAAAFSESGYQVELEPETGAAIELALAAAKAAGLPLLVTGSFYLCAEAAAALSKLGRY